MRNDVHFTVAGPIFGCPEYKDLTRQSSTDFGPIIFTGGYLNFSNDMTLLCDWINSSKDNPAHLFLTNEFDDELLMCAGVFKETLHQRIKWLNPLSGTFRVIHQCGINPFEFISNPTESAQKKIFSKLHELRFIDFYQKSKTNTLQIKDTSFDYSQIINDNRFRFENSFFATSKLMISRFKLKWNDISKKSEPENNFESKISYEDSINRINQYLQWIQPLFDNYLFERQNFIFELPNIWNLKMDARNYD